MRTLLVLMMVAPGMVFAAGDDDGPATPTPTTKNCIFGRVLDPVTNKCVKPEKQSSLDDDTLYTAAREFAYAGEFGHAQAALAAMSDQTEDRVLTYWGFTHRNIGNWDLGMSYYDQALRQNPDNILARSYYGQALVQVGDVAGAIEQLREIEARGGAGGWAEAQLRQSILTGSGYGRG